MLVYGYATGVFSSRKIERRLHEDLAFRMLVGSLAHAVPPQKAAQRRKAAATTRAAAALRPT